MRKDPTEFRERFAKWKRGEDVYKDGRPVPAFEIGKDGFHVEYIDAGKVRVDPETGDVITKTGARGGLMLPEVTVSGKRANTKNSKLKYDDYLTASNDATLVISRNPNIRSIKPINPHLAERANQGAKAHAAWEEEHPILNTVGLGLSTIPFVAAASPTLAPAGEAFAGTTLAGISAPMWTDAALTAGFGAHGLDHAINEGIGGWGDAAMTALEVAPLGRLVKPVYKGVIQPGMRLFNSPLTGNWTKIGNREYRLSPNSLGANGSPIESRVVAQQITAENAVRMTPEQWTAAQDAAIARGDMAEAQRLRDLHFKVSAPNTKITAISYRGSNIKNPVLRERVVDPDVGEMNGIYSSFDKKYASKYGNVEGLYINSENPLVTRGNWTGVINDAVKNKILRSGYDAVVNTDFDKAGKFLDFLRGGKRTENILFSGKKAKSAAPITYDDAGNIIPLGERDNFNINDIRYDMPSNDIIIENNVSATPNIPFDEAWLAASKGRHQMSNLVGSNDYASRVRQAYQNNGIPVNQADFEILQAKQGIKDSNLKVVPNLKNTNGEVLNGQYDPNTRQILVSQDRENILDIVESSGHEHAHASEVEKLLGLLKEKWKHIKPRKKAFTRSDGSVDTEWKDYISKTIEMRAPAMSVWSEMKELGFSKVGDYLHHLKRFGLEDKQWEALVNRYGLTNAKYMVETVFGLSPFVINGINNEEKNSTTNTKMGKAVGLEFK